MLSTSENNVITSSLVKEEPPAKNKSAAEQNTYGQILKSSTLVGGSSMLSIGIRIIRTKAMAILLGPAGFGLMGLFGSIADLVVSIVGMGISVSGVFQIAQSVGTGDRECIAKTIYVLRRLAMILGILGTVILVGFSRQLSNYTFGSYKYATAIAVLSLAVLFRLPSDGQAALIQGMRRIGDLVRMRVLGTFFGAIISIILVYFLREQGVAPSLAGAAAMGFLLSWWYSRKIRIQLPTMTAFEVGQKAGSLVKLGVVFMSSGFLAMSAAYAVKLIIARKVGLESAGFYQSAWALGGLYIDFILQAMAADFYPRLAAVASDNSKCECMVNEQTLVSLLLAGPGVIATLTFTPAVVALLYSSKFSAAVGVLRWICLGMTVRMIIWPLSTIIIAKGAKKMFFFADLSWTVADIGLSLICVSTFGLNGAGIAFFVSYVFQILMIYPIVNRISGFQWSAANRRTALLFFSLIAVVFCGCFMMAPLWATLLGSMAVIFSGFYSLRILSSLISLESFPGPIKRAFSLVGMTPKRSQ